MATNPFESLMKKQQQQTTANPYDNDSIWSAPVEQPTQSVGGYYTGKGATNYFVPQTVQETTEDPLEYPRGQINYYTQKMNDAGIDLPAPDAIDNKESMGSKVFQKAMDILQVTGTPINAVAGVIDEAIKSFDDEDDDSVLKNIGDSLLAGLKSGASTLLAPLDSDLREHRRDLSDVFTSARESDNEVISGISDAVETINPIYGVARLFGAEDESAKKISGTLTSMVLDMAISAKLDIDGIGKALKVVNRGDEMATIAKYTTGDEALKIAKEVVPNFFKGDIDKVAKAITKSVDGTGTNYDAAVKLLRQGYGDEAASILKRANKKLGGLGDYKGVTMGNKTLLSVDQLKNIGSTKTGKVLANIVGGYMSPVGLAWSGLSGRSASQLSKGNVLYEAFSNGKYQDFVKQAYSSLQEGDTEGIISAIYGAKHSTLIHNIKNTADTLTNKQATELQKLLSVKGISTDAISEAIELHGSKDFIEELVQTPRINKKYIKAAGENMTSEMKKLKKEQFLQDKYLEGLSPEDLKKELEDYKVLIDTADGVGVDDLVPDKVVDPQVGPNDFNNRISEAVGKEFVPVMPAEVSADFKKQYDAILNAPMETPQQRAAVTRRVKKLLNEESAEELKYAGNVPNVANTASGNILGQPNFDSWSNEADELGEIKLNTLKDIAEKNKEYLPQPNHNIETPEQYIEQLNELRRIDDRKFYKITEQELEEILKDYEDLGVNITEQQYENIANLARYEGKSTDEIVDDIFKEKELISYKKKYRDRSVSTAQRDIDEINNLIVDSGRKKIFLQSKSKDFYRYNTSYSLIEKALSLDKMIKEDNPALSKYFSEGLIDRVKRGDSSNSYSRDELVKVFEKYLDAWQDKMPKTKWKWLEKHGEEVIDSWKNLSNSEIEALKRHYTMFNLKPEMEFNKSALTALDGMSPNSVVNPTSKKAMDKNDEVVQSLVSNYEVENDILQDATAGFSDKQRANAYAGSFDEADKYSVNQEQRDRWLAETQEDPSLSLYNGTNSNEYWDKQDYRKAVYEAQKDGNMKVYNAETGKYELSKKEKAITLYRRASIEAETPLKNGKESSIPKDKQWMIEVGDNIREAEKLRNKAFNTNRGLLAKGEQIFQNFLKEKKIISIPSTARNEVNMLKVVDDINSNISKIIRGDEDLAMAFYNGGQDALYKHIAESLGLDFDSFMDLKSMDDLQSFNSNLAMYMRRQALSGNDEYKKILNIKIDDQISINNSAGIKTSKDRASALEKLLGENADELLESGLLDEIPYDNKGKVLEGFVEETADDLSFDDLAEGKITEMPKTTAEPRKDISVNKAVEKNTKEKVRSIEEIMDTPYKELTPLEKQMKYNHLSGIVDDPNNPAVGKYYNPPKKDPQPSEFWQDFQKRKKEWDDAHPKAQSEVSPFKQSTAESYESLRYKTYDELNPMEKRVKEAGVKEAAKDATDATFSQPATLSDRTKIRARMTPEEVTEMVEDIKTLDPAERAKDIKYAEERYLADLYKERGKIQKDYNYQSELHDKALFETKDGTAFMEANLKLVNLEKKLKDVNSRIGDLMSFENAVGNKELRLKQVQEAYKMLDTEQGKYETVQDKIKELIKVSSTEADIAEWFSGKDASKGIDQFEYVTRVVDSLSYNDTVSLLSKDEKLVAEFLRDVYKDMADKEGLKPLNEIREFFGYLPHMANPELQDDPKVIALSKKLGFDIKSPFSTNHMSRSMNGTILELNRVIEAKYGVKDFFETNVLRQFVNRSLHSNNFVAKKDIDNMMKNVFETPIITANDFRKLELDGMKDVLEKLGLDTSHPDWDMSFGMRDTDRLASDYARKTRGDVLEPTKFTTPGKTDYANNLVGAEFPDEMAGQKIKEVYVQRYYDFINEIKKGNNEKYVLARRDEETVSTVHKIINDKALNRMTDSGASMKAEQDALEALGTYGSEEDIIADVIAEGTFENGKRPTYSLFSGEVSDLTVEQIVEKGYTIVNRNIANQYNSIMANMTRKKAGKFTTFYNKIMNVFKAWAVTSPGFHLNNVVGNNFNSVIQVGMDVFDPKVQKEAYNLLTELKKVDYDFSKLTGEIYGVSKADLAREIVNNGVFSTFFNTDVNAVKDMASGLTEQIAEQGFIKRNIGKVNPFDTENNVLLNANKNFGEFLEQQGKISNIMAHLKQGRDMYEAIDLAQEALFDYSDITNFEADVIKQFVAPFYTFAKKNFSYQAENMANNPGVYTFIERLYRYVDENFTSEKERMLRPDYISGGLKIADGKYLQVDTPMHSFINMFEPSNLLGMVNPMAKTVTDMAYNTKSYSGNPISKYNDPLEKMQYGIEGILPFMQTSNTVTGLFSDDPARREKGLRWLAGNRVKIYDEENAERSAIYDYMEELQKTWYKSIEKNPELKAIAEEAALSRKGNKNKNPFAAMLGK